MPFIQLTQLPSKKSFLLWELKETESELLQLFQPNHLDEQSLLDITNKKKRLEFLGGRITIKTLALKLGIPFHGLSNDQYGKPHLLDSSFQVSVSHCFPFAAGILSQDVPVGIDIQILDPKLLVLAPKFLNSNELAFSESNLTMIGVLWAAKETLYKVYGRKRLIFRENLEVSKFNLDNSGEISGKIKIGDQTLIHSLSYAITDHFVLCYTH
ncbi:MAG: hypothetical protein O7F74_00860 [Bacteroidetes bacterium]|nr:hypothetical protein [Bacteroidota bacterium]